MPPQERGTNSTASRRIARTIRERINRGGERLWRPEDFKGMPSTAVVQTLSRLTRQGVLQRLSRQEHTQSGRHPQTRLPAQECFPIGHCRVSRSRHRRGDLQECRISLRFNLGGSQYSGVVTIQGRVPPA
jgi:hypothetical protein